MAEPLRITSVDNPRVKAVVRLREQRERRKTGLFLADGLRAIERAARARLVCRELYVCPEMLGDDGPGVRAPGVPLIPVLGAGAVLIDVTAGVMEKIGWGENPEGAVGVFEQRELELRDLPRAEAKAALYLVAVGVSKPGNLGAMARTASAAGAAGLIVADGVVDIYNPNAIRASTGAVFTLPVAAAEAGAVIAFARERKLRLFAAALGDGVAYTRADLGGPLAIVIGAEDTGLEVTWLDAAKASGGSAIHIPMREGVVDSLNASNAAAVLLFEAARQRGA